MDGLTVSRANKFVESGKTFSEIKQSEMNMGSKASAAPGQSFADTMKEAVLSVDKAQKKADVLMQKLATGEAQNIPEVMMAAEKADIAFKLLVKVRNKIIDAYQEVMKMQV